jgi:tetraacyldisaccharide 4'-kinase
VTSWWEKGAAQWLLWPLSLLYRLWMHLRAAAYRFGAFTTHRLPGKVVSIGNLTVGGAGKTPLVLRVALWLRQHGARTAILTRGYGRRDRQPLVMNGLGDVTRYTPELMGDEPILFAHRAPEASIGIGADRVLLAQQILALEKELSAPVFLLDDGFQHQRLARDLDIVVVDAANPFGNGRTLPAGRLREPKSALKRAGIIVLNRARDEPAEELVKELRRYNPRAPLFRAWTELESVCEVKSGRQANLFVLKQQPVLAFCGIGNPQAFWDDLFSWGLQVTERRAYPDHHRYSEADLKELQAAAQACGAKALVTTEKDRINLIGLPSTAVPAFYCRIDLAIDREEEFFSTVRDCLQREAD